MYEDSYDLSESKSRRIVLCTACNQTIKYNDIRLKVIRGRSSYGWPYNYFYCEKCMKNIIKNEIKLLENTIHKLIDLLK